MFQFIFLKPYNLITNFEVKKYKCMKVSPDRLFLSRVLKYIKEHRNDKILDSDELVTALRKYPEYHRHKYVAVKNMAGKAVYKLNTCNFELDNADNVDEESESEVDDDGRQYSSDDEDGTEIGGNLPTYMNGVPPVSVSNTDVEMDGVSDVTSTVDYPTMQVLTNKLYGGKRRNESAQYNVEHTPSAPSSKHTVSKEFGKRPQVNTPLVVPKRRKHMIVDPYDSDILHHREQDSTITKTVKKDGINKKRPLPQVPLFSASLDAVDREDACAKLVPNISFANVAGCTSVLQSIMQFIVHIHHPEIFEYLGIQIPRGFLLHGPHGCGKTLIAHAVAGELKLPLLDIAATELVTGISGQSEERIRQVFDKSLSHSPCVLFIDEIDAICSNRDNSNRDMERRIVSQLLLSIDNLNKVPAGSQVLLIGATSRPESLDPALRRAGRFDNEVLLGIPDEESRHEMLKLLCSRLQLSAGICLKELAHLTPGFVGADLLALVRESTLNAVRRVVVELGMIAKNESFIDLVDDDDLITSSKKRAHEPQPCEHGQMIYTLKQEDSQLDPFDLDKRTMNDVLRWIRHKTRIDPCYLKQLSVTKNDFMIALKKVQPSSKREGFATVPNVTWNDIGSLKDIRRDLHRSLVEPLKHQKFLSDVGISPGCGVLLYGPPGCGKTLIAKAMANEAGINFISVKGPELLNMYFGGSEKAVRDCFQRARNSQPCIIFFDELDALCPKRTDSDISGSTSRIVNQMLTEMDGIEGRGGVLLMAATNRIDIIDSAILRPGRFDKVLYVGFPHFEDRVDILRTIAQKGRRYIDADVDFDAIAKNQLCEGFTGADMAALFREATTIALNECLKHDKSPTNNGTIAPVICSRHFKQAMHKVRPSVSRKERMQYDRMKHTCWNTHRKPEQSRSKHQEYKHVKRQKTEEEIGGGSRYDDDDASRKDSFPPDVAKVSGDNDVANETGKKSLAPTIIDTDDADVTIIGDYQKTSTATNVRQQSQPLSSNRNNINNNNNAVTKLSPQAKNKTAGIIDDTDDDDDDDDDSSNQSDLPYSLPTQLTNLVQKILNNTPTQKVIVNCKNIVSSTPVNGARTLKVDDKKTTNNNDVTASKMNSAGSIPITVITAATNNSNNTTNTTGYLGTTTAAGFNSKAVTNTSSPIANISSGKAFTNASSGNKAVTNTSSSNKAVTNISSSNKPVKHTSSSNKPVTNTSSSNKPVTNISSSNKPVTNTSSSNKPVTNTSSSNKAVTNTTSSKTVITTSSSINSNVVKKHSDNCIHSTKNNNNSNTANNSNGDSSSNKNDNNNKSMKFFHQFNYPIKPSTASVMNGQFGRCSSVIQSKSQNVNNSQPANGATTVDGSNIVNNVSKPATDPAVMQKLYSINNSNNNNNNKMKEVNNKSTSSNIVTLSDIIKDQKTGNENDNGGGTVTILPTNEKPVKPKQAVLKLSSATIKTLTTAAATSATTTTTTTASVINANPGSSKELPDFIYQLG